MTRLSSVQFHATLRLGTGPTLTSIHASVDEWRRQVPLAPHRSGTSFDGHKLCKADVRRTPVAAALQTLLAQVRRSLSGRLPKKIADIKQCKTRRRVLCVCIGLGGGAEDVFATFHVRSPYQVSTVARVARTLCGHRSLHSF